LALPGSFRPETGFEMGLNWLYLGSFGFVFYHKKHHLTSVKSGDPRIFKLALFRNFYFLSQSHQPQHCLLSALA